MLLVLAIYRETSLDASMGLERSQFRLGKYITPLDFGYAANHIQLMATFCFGFMGFSAVSFFLSLYLQEVKHLTALDITVRLLPMVVSGVLVNVVCGLILHRVSNKLLTGVGALAYTTSFLILSFMKEDAIYWAYIFPALLLVVVGADIQFNVTNVSVSANDSG